MSTEPAEAAAPRRRIKEMEVMVAEVISETPDTATLVLFTGNDRLDYQPGHFLTVDPHQFESPGRRIVPNFSIIKHALLHHPRLRHTLVYSNRTWTDTIFGRDLNALEAKHPDQLRVVHTLTRQDPAPGLAREVRHGRLTASLLREVVGDPTACRVYLCGPAVSTWDKKAAKEKGVEPAPRFLEGSLAALEEIGVPKAHVTRESYG